MRKRAWISIAFLAAPLAPGILCALAVVVLIPADDGWHGSPAIAAMALAGGAFASAVIGYPAALILGVPAYYVLRRSGYRSRRAYGVAGAAVGGLGWAGLQLLDWTADRATPHDARIPTLIMLAVCGAIAGFTFRLIAPPDRYPPKQHDAG